MTSAIAPAVDVGFVRVLSVLGNIINGVTLGFTTTAEFNSRFAQAERDLKNRPQAVLETALGLIGNPFDQTVQPSSLEQGLALGLACRACLELGQWVEALRYGSQAVALLHNHPNHHADAQVALGLSQLPLGEYNAALGVALEWAHYQGLGKAESLIESKSNTGRTEADIARAIALP